MRYVMKQKFFSLGDSFAIRNEEGQEVFIAQGKVISFGDQLTLRDASGEEVAYIRQKVFSWGPTYEIYRGGQLFAVVKKKLFTFFKHVFTVDVPGPDDLEAVGDFLDYEYEFRRGDTVVGRISKKFFSWSDTYGIEVVDPADALVILTATVVIDAICHDEQDD